MSEQVSLEYKSEWLSRWFMDEREIEWGKVYLLHHGQKGPDKQAMQITYDMIKNMNSEERHPKNCDNNLKKIWH